MEDLDFSRNRWFSNPQPTIEDAQALCPYELFEPAAIFRRPDGKYEMARLRVREWSEQFVVDAAQKLKELLDYQMVSYRGPLLNVWRSFEDTV